MTADATGTSTRPPHRGELPEPAIGPSDSVAYALETTPYYAVVCSWAPRAGTPAAFLGKRPMSLCSNQASKWQLHEGDAAEPFLGKTKLGVAQLSVPWGHICVCPGVERDVKQVVNTL